MRTQCFALIVEVHWLSQDKCGKHEGYKEIITCPVCKQTIEVGKYETGYTSPYVLQTMYKIEADKQAKKEKIIEEAKALGLHLA